MKRIILMSLAIALFATLGGFSVLSADRLAEVKARAQEYWVLKIDNRFESAYEMLTEESKAEFPYKRFSRIQNVVASKLLSVEAAPDPKDPNHALVSVVYDAKVMGQDMPGLKTQQHWYRRSGNWYLKYEIPNPFNNVPLPTLNAPPTKSNVKATHAQKGDAKYAPRQKKPTTSSTQTPTTVEPTPAPPK